MTIPGVARLLHDERLLLSDHLAGAVKGLQRVHEVARQGRARRNLRTILHAAVHRRIVPDRRVIGRRGQRTRC